MCLPPMTVGIREDIVDGVSLGRTLEESGGDIFGTSDGVIFGVSLGASDCARFVLLCVVDGALLASAYFAFGNVEGI
jgi:hypothetical protein